MKSSEIKFRPLEQPNESESEILLSKEDIYKLLHLRGFDYKYVIFIYFVTLFLYFFCTITWTNILLLKLILVLSLHFSEIRSLSNLIIWNWIKLIFRNEFQTLESSNVERTQAKIKWNEDWVTYIDALIQLNLFSKDSEGLSIPKFIKVLSIDPFKHNASIAVEGSEHSAHIFSFYGVTR